MRDIAFFLNGQRGLSVLQAIVDHGHMVSAVYAPPTALTQLAPVGERLGISLIAAPDVNASSFLAAFEAREHSLSIIGGYSQIFRRPLIDLPKFGTINLHGGRLPQYRGGSPLNWQIIAGERMAGVSVIRVDDGIDTGNVLAEALIPITAQMTIADLHDAANQVFPDLVLDVLARLAQGNLQERVQNPDDAVYWHQRNDADGRIDWHRMTARQVHDLVRGLTRPYPGAFTFLDGQRIRVFATSIPEFHLKGVPGRVCHIGGQGILVVCADRAIRILDYASDPGIRLSHGVHLT